MLGCSAALLAGCGGAGESEDAAAGAHGNGNKATAKAPERPRGVMVTGEGWESPADLGILLADREGFFREAGLSVWFGAPASPTRPVGYVTGGTDMLGVTHPPQLAMAKEKGAPIVAVGSLVSRPTAAMIWLKRSKIRDLSDLRGKTVAIPGLPFQKAFLESALTAAGLKPGETKVKTVGYDLVPALLSGRADAIFGGSANQEGVELRASGAEPVITPMRELGVPAYEELVLIARQDLVEEDPKLIRDFMAAVARGTKVAAKHPGLAVKVLKEGGEANPEVSWKTMEAEVKATLPLVSRDGRMDSERTDDLLAWMHEEGMIEAGLTASDLLTNDYLAGP